MAMQPVPKSICSRCNCKGPNEGAPGNQNYARMETSNPPRQEISPSKITRVFTRERVHKRQPRTTSSSQKDINCVCMGNISLPKSLWFIQAVRF